MRCVRNQWIRNSRHPRPIRAGWAWLVVAMTLFLVPKLVAAQGGIRVENAIWVPATGDAVDNCQRLRDTLDGLPTSQTHVVHLAAGAYWCLSSTLLVPHGVTLVGVGPRTLILGNIDNAVLGVVHLEGNADLHRVQVQNSESSPINAAIAVSAWELSSFPGSPDLVDVDAYVSVSAGTAHPLFALQENVTVEGGSFVGGDIRLAGTSFAFSLSGSSIEGVDADATVTTSCHFYVKLPAGSTSENPFGTCP